MRDSDNMAVLIQRQIDTHLVAADWIVRDPGNVRSVEMTSAMRVRGKAQYLFPVERVGHRNLPDFKRSKRRAANAGRRVARLRGDFPA